MAAGMPQYRTDLRARTQAVAIAAYRLSKDARARYPVLRNYADQMCDAAGSIGANLSESDGFNSNRELAARYAIALKESKEACIGGGAAASRVQRVHCDVQRGIEETAAAAPSLVFSLQS